MWSPFLKVPGVKSALIWLTAVLLAALGGVGGWSWSREGMTGLAASCLAAGVCWAASLAAIFITARTCNTPKALAGVLGGILVRTGVPMAAAVAASNLSQPLAEAGVFGKFVIFFLISLAVETWRAVAIVNASCDKRMPPETTTAG